MLLEQHEHLQPEGRRMVSAESMTAIPELDDVPALQITTHPRSSERLDKSIAPIHRGTTRCICASGVTVRHSTLFTL